MDGSKDPWPLVLSLPKRFVGDPASLARDNIVIIQNQFVSAVFGLQKRTTQVCYDYKRRKFPKESKDSSACNGCGHCQVGCINVLHNMHTQTIYHP